jgi:hypothetical protein
VSDDLSDVVDENGDEGENENESVESHDERLRSQQWGSEGLQMSDDLSAAP